MYTALISKLDIQEAGFGLDEASITKYGELHLFPDKRGSLYWKDSGTQITFVFILLPKELT